MSMSSGLEAFVTTTFSEIPIGDDPIVATYDDHRPF